MNPNGSQGGVTGVTTNDGRILIMMPHPERVTRTLNMSWSPVDYETGKSIWKGSDEDEFDTGPWMCMFRNVRKWVG